MQRSLLLLSVFLMSPLVWSSPIGPISDIKIKAYIAEEASCKNFKPSRQQVHEFFEQAIVITGKQMHDHFLTGPCFAEGTLKNRYDTWQWRIRNMGTATLINDNEDLIQLGDPQQEVNLNN